MFKDTRRTHEHATYGRMAATKGKQEKEYIKSRKGVSRLRYGGHTQDACCGRMVAAKGKKRERGVR